MLDFKSDLRPWFVLWNEATGGRVEGSSFRLVDDNEGEKLFAAKADLSVFSH